MANLRLSKELAKEIGQLGGKSVSRIVRLAPKTASAYLRLVQRSGNDKQVIAAVETYLVVARRAERHADDATKKLFAATDDFLTERLTGMAGKDMELLRRELAQRRLAVLRESPDVPRKGPARARQVSRIPDADAANLFGTFLDRLRTVAALGRGNWDDAQRLLMRGRRKLLAAIGGQWADGWDAPFNYLRDHAAKIAARARELRAAEKVLEEARKSGSLADIRAAEQQLRTARSAAEGYLSKIKGLLGEAYVPRWKDWEIQMEGFLEVARREAKGLSGRWDVQRVVGGLRIDGAEAWDEAILLVNRETKEVKLFLAAQYKVEKRVSALKQAQNDALRETATASGRLPSVTFVVDDVVHEGFELTPMPVGKSVHRYVFNAGGGKFSAADIERLRLAGIEVNQLNLDISVPEFDQVARAMMDAVADAVP